MKSATWRQSVLFLIPFLGLFMFGATAPASDHVVLICIDGLPASLIHDSRASLPTLRELARRGVVAEGMVPSNPSVTWPNHTTLITGANPEHHGVLFNGVLVRGGLGLPVKVNPFADHSELVRIPTIADALHAQGRTVVAMNWPCTRNSKSYLADIPDTPQAINYSTPRFIDELIEAKVVPADIRETFNKMPVLVRDQIWTDAACYALKTYRPALTLVHLLNLDSTHHRYGPETTPGFTAMALQDAHVREILQAIDEAGIRESTTVLIVSDHGFMAIPKTILPNVALRKAGLLTVEGKQVTAARVHAIPEGGIAMVYLTRPDTAAADRDAVKTLFQSVEGIAEVLTPESFGKYGLPDPEEYSQMADLILVAKDGYGFGGTATGEDVIVESSGTLGTHGFLSSNPKMLATFIAAGAGIQPGVPLKVIENHRVAPTIARLLNVELGAATGTPLDEILTSSPSQKP